jgi:hypothetical protein
MSNAIPIDPPDGEKIAVLARRNCLYIHRRVDLDEVIIGTRSDVTATSRNDTSRHRPTKAERIADRHHPVADSRSRFRKLDVWEITAAIHLD